MPFDYEPGAQGTGGGAASGLHGVRDVRLEDGRVRAVDASIVLCEIDRLRVKPGRNRGDRSERGSFAAKGTLVCKRVGGG